ncbi:hypothetical protein PGT21_012818 [Puccinia graminis f. sp. tritici]|uniref:Uncharacterized protein n=1 Tax=Puccinia graminis f. sp. tritici TaxID=56615 RepID=A0A5B0M3W1_PUCGR|nr:hypothetical protein PGT21_012818 [Puccinia graminis f. sp. tritici]KAA1089938.1 hypothetical protein PGTUg99_030669 [Puccinia graminis f. sp. tritici]
MTNKSASGYADVCLRNGPACGRIIFKSGAVSGCFKFRLFTPGWRSGVCVCFDSAAGPLYAKDACTESPAPEDVSPAAIPAQSTPLVRPSETLKTCVSDKGL